MIQRQNPATNVFQEPPIYFKGNSSSFICSLNKSLFGIYEVKQRAELTQFNQTLEVIDGEIIIFQLKEKRWIEYFNMKIQSNTILELLCFTKNNKQLLFYKYCTNCIESLDLNSLNELRSQQISNTIKCFFQFQQDKEKIYMILSNDQSILLIETKSVYLVFNVIVASQMILFVLFKKKQNNQILSSAALINIMFDQQKREDYFFSYQQEQQ